MPLHPLKTNFTAGELTERLDARVDIDKYQNGASCLQNAVPMVHGGATRRAGTSYVSKGKTVGKKVRLIPFRVNQTTAYVCEFGENYIRFYKNRAVLRNVSSSPAANITLSATTGNITITASVGVFASTDLGREVQASGGRAVITGYTSATVVSATVLVDFGATSYLIGTWTYTGAPVEVTTTYTEAELRELRYAQANDVMYICHPSHPVAKLSRGAVDSFTFSDVNFQPPPVSEQPSTFAVQLTLSAVSGTTVTVTAASATFLQGDIGRQITWGVGRLVLKAYTSATVMTAEVLDTFASTTLPAGEWSLRGSPNCDLKFPKKSPVGLSQTVDSVIATYELLNGQWQYTTVSGADAFRSSDVVMYIVGLGGMAKITQFLNARSVQVEMIHSLTWTLNDPAIMIAGAWTLERPAWSASLGYPGAVCFHEQRLMFAGASVGLGVQTVWGSASGDFENFARGANNDDSVVYVIAANSLNIIRWMTSLGTLLIG